MKKLLSLAAAAALAACAGAHAAELSARLRRAFRAGRLPRILRSAETAHDAIVPADVRRNVEFLEASFRKRGFVTRQLENDGKPMLFAELPGADPQRKTVLFYMHLDGSPSSPSSGRRRVRGFPCSSALGGG